MLETSLKSLIKESLDDKLFKNPQFSLSVGVLYKGKTILDTHFGRKYKRYDLASMTKAIFLSSLVINKHPEILNKKVSELLPWLNDSFIKVESLLTHTSGLLAHKKIYLKLDPKKDKYEKKSFLKKFLRDEFNNIALDKKAHSPVYSDIGYLLLGEVLESYTNKPLIKLWEELKKDCNYPKGLSFSSKKIETAPTEKCEWRKRVIQGEVFDRNAFVLGGVEPHAGLFGSSLDMIEFGKFLRANYKLKKTFYKKKKEGWATGFMIPSGKLSTAGSCFSKKSIGHLGYTGTSFWYDPDKDLYVSVLSNRTFPDRDNVDFNKFRPVIHNVIYKKLVGEK